MNQKQAARAAKEKMRRDQLRHRAQVRSSNARQRGQRIERRERRAFWAVVVLLALIILYLIWANAPK